MKVIIIICILIIAILAFIDIIPIRKWYYLFKSKTYGVVTRVKIKVIRLFDFLF